MGFEPTDGSPRQRFSRPSPSSARPPSRAKSSAPPRIGDLQALPRVFEERSTPTPGTQCEDSVQRIVGSERHGHLPLRVTKLLPGLPNIAAALPDPTVEGTESAAFALARKSERQLIRVLANADRVSHFGAIIDGWPPITCPTTSATRSTSTTPTRGRAIGLQSPE